jgi:4-hydroxybenzoate polyprenyltransferase
MSAITTGISRYFSLIKFSHTIFAMPFALTGFFIAASQDDYGFSLRVMTLVVLCMIFARSAAMAFNRFIDRKYDSLNPRTSVREIPSGIISHRAALWFVVISSLLFIVAAGLINHLTLILSPVALLVVLGYSLTKRFTVLCHFILGLGLSLAPIGAYISVTGQFDLLPLIYSAIVLTWVGGFDIIYSLQDDEFDRLQKLFSIPAKMGRTIALRLSVTAHILTVAFVLAAGVIGNSGLLFWIGATIFSILLTVQHRMVKPDDLSRVTMAFATTNGIASILFAAFVVADLYLGKL